jgi:hypothetical protein
MFRFTIRDVLWLTVVVALGVGWWIEHCAGLVEAERSMAVLRVELVRQKERAEGLNVLLMEAREQWIREAVTSLESITLKFDDGDRDRAGVENLRAAIESAQKVLLKEEQIKAESAESLATDSTE